jgi:hydrogenase expression/formation protein HypE
MLGLDPLYVANEGVAVAIVASEDAEDVLEAARGVDVGAHTALIGTVEEGAPRVSLKTGLGATRPLIVLAGDQLPRIC